jgi:hypothetical protein
MQNEVKQSVERQVMEQCESIHPESKIQCELIKGHGEYHAFCIRSLRTMKVTDTVFWK